MKVLVILSLLIFSSAQALLIPNQTELESTLYHLAPHLLSAYPQFLSRWVHTLVSLGEEFSAGDLLLLFDETVEKSFDLDFGPEESSIDDYNQFFHAAFSEQETFFKQIFARDEDHLELDRAFPAYLDRKEMRARDQERTIELSAIATLLQP